MWTPLFVLVGLCLLAFPTVQFARRIRMRSKLYNFEHLTEVARGLKDIRKDLDRSGGSSRQGRFETGQGVVVLYTVVAGQGVHAHHLDLSVMGARLATSTAAFLVTYILTILEVEAKDIECARTATWHYHVSFKVDRRTHRRILQGRARVPQPDELSALVGGCLRRSREVKFEVIERAPDDESESKPSVPAGPSI